MIFTWEDESDTVRILTALFDREPDIEELARATLDDAMRLPNGTRIYKGDTVAVHRTVSWVCYTTLDRKSIENIQINPFDMSETESSSNNGGKTDYYQLPVDKKGNVTIKDFDDFAEWRGMNGNQFNIGKVVWTFNVGRHEGTDYERELNKIIHYANRELKRIKR